MHAHLHDPVTTYTYHDALALRQTHTYHNAPRHKYIHIMMHPFTTYTYHDAPATKIYIS